MVKGYSIEMKSHNDVAEAILKGNADVGLGIRASAITHRLSFLPVTQESFDFVVEEARLGKPLLDLFLEQLASKEFSNKAKRLGFM
jgi:putative molybdopterin biosynthesis protein